MAEQQDINSLQQIIATQEQEISILKNIIDTLPSSIYWKDKEGAYLGYNLSGEKNVRELGFIIKREDVLGKTDHQLLPKETADGFRQNDLHVMETGQEHRSEEIAILPNGAQAVQISLKWPLRDKSDEIIGIVGTTTDITYLKKIEADLFKAKEEAEAAIRAKDDFIHNVEHDIRTPFSGIWALANYLESTETDLERKEHLKDISCCAKELLDYCNSILQFAKTEAGIMPIISKKMNLHMLINKIISMETPPAKIKKLALITEVDPNVPAVIIGDPQRIQRILINLVSNAVKFTETGFVKISVQLKKQMPETRKIILQFLVEDSGIGIPKDKYDYIYEKFSRLIPASLGTYKGSGLGLRVVKQLINEIEGEIDIKSESNKGSIFICTIPFQLPILEEMVED